jgi:FG-GAP-like repeat
MAANPGTAASRSVLSRRRKLTWLAGAATLGAAGMFAAAVDTPLTRWASGIDNARLQAVAREHPNATGEQRSAILRAAHEALHPSWRTLSWPARLARVALFNRGSALAQSAGLPPAPFLGNYTVVAAPAGQGMALARQADCSLTLYMGPYAIAPTPSYTIDTTTQNFEQVLHADAQLTTQADVFAKGCADPALGIGWHQAISLGETSQQLYMGAGVGFDGTTNSEVLYYATTATSLLKVNTFNTDTSLAGIFGVAGGDLNGDGLPDIVAFSNSSPTLTVWLAQANGSIGTPVNYTLRGNTGEAVLVADVNGDGKLDVVAASSSSAGQETITVFLGNGHGVLTAAQTLNVSTPGGQKINNLVAADFRNTGHLDIVASNGLVLLNNGAGVFTAASTVAFAPVTAESNLAPNLAAADFNNDGKIDLAVDNGSTVSVFLGQGDGTFTAGRRYASIGDAGFVAATDLDGDGNADLYVGPAGGGAFSSDQPGANNSYVLMGNGDGSFQGAAAPPFVYTGRNLADLNNDGKIDAVGIAATNQAFTSYLGDGQGNFAAQSSVTFTPITLSGQSYTVTPESYALGDLNGDGHVDLAYIGDGFNGPAGGPGVFIALGDGQGGFAAPTFYAVPSTLAAGDNNISWSIYNLHLADVNGDGKADLIYNYTTISSQLNTVYFGTVVQLSNGNGIFQAPQVIPYRSEVYSSTFNPNEASYVAQIADLNGDGHLDLVFLAQSLTIDPTLSTPVASIQVALGKGDGTFSTPATVTGPNIMVQAFEDALPPSITIADMNGDGIPDIVALGSSSGSYNAQIGIALGKGGGTFQAPFLLTTGAQYLNNEQTVAVGNFSGGGKMDVALLDPYQPGASGVFLGNGDGTLQSTGTAPDLMPNLAINLIANGPAAAVLLAPGGTTALMAANLELLPQAAPAQAPTFAVTATEDSGTVSPGQSASTQLTLTPSGGFSGAVSLACSGLPTGATCAFAPAAVTLAGTAVTTTLTLHTTGSTAQRAPGGPAWPDPEGILLAGILLPFLQGVRPRARLRRRVWRAGLVLLALAVGGCGGGGGGTSSGSSGGGGTGTGSAGATPAGSYAITITASGGAVTKTFRYTLTVS